MARERWFYAEGHRRMGPVARRELVEALLQLTDPRTCLIWRRGMQTWSAAAEVPDIDQLLASIATDTRPQPPTPVPTAAPEVEARRPPSARPARPRAGGRRQGSASRLYTAGALAAVAIGALAWLWWSRPAPSVPPSSSTTPHLEVASAPAPLPDAAAVATPLAAAADGGRTVVGWGALEADLPPAELRRLRGVGGWTADKLTITLYNGSSWRVTEIFVLTSRMEGDRFVDPVAPQLLLPVGGIPLEGAVQDLLQKVAPDRKRAGVNPADTGPFEVVLGPSPAAYRWKIERARGYPPRVAP